MVIAPQASASTSTTTVCLTNAGDDLIATVPNETATTNRIPLQNPLTPVTNASASAAAGSTVSALVNDVGIFSADEEDVDNNKTDITDDDAWQNALTIMLF